jgi:hypothetical protein
MRLGGASHRVRSPLDCPHLSAVAQRAKADARAMTQCAYRAAVTWISIFFSGGAA